MARKPMTIKAPKGETLYVVRAWWSEPTSETIATGISVCQAEMRAVAWLEANERDYECFDMVLVDDKGAVVEILDGVSWEPSRATD